MTTELLITLIIASCVKAPDPGACQSARLECVQTVAEQRERNAYALSVTKDIPACLRVK